MKKQMKKVLALGLATVMAAGITACSAPAKEETAAATKTAETQAAGEVKDEYKIAVLLPGPTGYFVATKEGIDAAVKENNVKIEYADAQWDASKQLAQAEDFIVKGVDLIAICSVDSGSGEKIVKSANESNIPILAFTNAIGGEESGQYDGLVSYVGQNEVNTGAVTGELAKQLLGKDGGKAILIEGVPGTTPQINRKKRIRTGPGRQQY